jgi:hypothetical protein
MEARMVYRLVVYSWSWSRICIKVKSRIRDRIKVVRIRNSSHFTEPILDLAFKKILNRIQDIIISGAVVFMVRRGSIDNVSACCKAGPSSILGSAPQGGFSH